MLSLPPLYPITDPARDEPLSEQVRRLGQAGFPLVQFRAKDLDANSQWRELRAALAAARDDGGWPAICVNDRADLALLAAREGLPPWGLHLGQDDLPPAEARRLPGLGDAHLGGSTHGPEHWDAPAPEWDHAGVGPLRPTASKPGHAAPIGLDGLARGCAALRRAGITPVAIGGLTLDDAEACFRAGAESLAMVAEVARAEDPRDLLWQVQAARWRVRPPFRRGQGLVLLGPSGGGKSSLARRLGERLGLPVRDADELIERGAGTSIAAIFQERGEAAFRALEAESVRRCLEAPAVVALGAGAWEDPDTRAAVRVSGFQPLWLAEVPNRAWDRVGQDPVRPLTAARDTFMARCARRRAAWSEAPMVLPLDRGPLALAAALAAAQGN
jgi:thiamine-phosphate pyrophosphorylase